ncbi:MAG: IclR family transcriptional regulator [Acidimicrobiia bacterium]
MESVPHRSDRGVQSVDRAFAILGAVAVIPAGVSEVARRTGLAVSTCARLLSTLEWLGAVARVDPGPVYRIGRTMHDLAASLDPTSGLVTRVRPHLEALVAEVGETAGIAVADGARHVLYLDQVESGQDVTLQDWTGHRLPLHVVSSGLVLLADRTAAAVRDYCAPGLDRFTEHTTTRATTLRTRLAAARTDGFAWTVEEFAAGISSVAAPVVEDGVVVAALHVHGPSYRLRPSNRKAVRALLATVRRFARA